MKLINNIEKTLIVFSLVLMTTITFGNVLSRYLFHASWSIAEEITTILFVWVTFLGASVATKRKGHLGLTILTDYLPPALKRKALFFSIFCSISVFVLLMVYGIMMVMSQYKMAQTSPALGWPEWLFGIAVPIGSFLLIVRFIELGYEELKGGNQ